MEKKPFSGEDFIFAGCWIFADLDGTLVPTPVTSKGKYTRIHESCCFDVLKEWLYYGGNLCIISTANQRVFWQLWPSLRDLLRVIEIRRKVYEGTLDINTLAANHSYHAVGTVLISPYTGAELFEATSLGLVGSVPYRRVALRKHQLRMNELERAATAAGEKSQENISILTSPTPPSKGGFIHPTTKAILQAIRRQRDRFSPAPQGLSGVNRKVLQSTMEVVETQRNSAIAASLKRDGNSTTHESTSDVSTTTTTCMDLETALKIVDFFSEKLMEFIEDIIASAPEMKKEKNDTAATTAGGKESKNNSENINDSSSKEKQLQQKKTSVNSGGDAHVPEQTRPPASRRPGARNVSVNQLSGRYRFWWRWIVSILRQLTYYSHSTDEESDRTGGDDNFFETHPDYTAVTDEEAMAFLRQNPWILRRFKAVIVEYSHDYWGEEMLRKAEKQALASYQLLRSIDRDQYQRWVARTQEKEEIENERAPQVAQVIILGIPMKLFPMYFGGLDHIWKQMGVQPISQPNSIVVAKYGVHKGVCISYVTRMEDESDSGHLEQELLLQREVTISASGKRGATMSTAHSATANPGGAHTLSSRRLSTSSVASSSGGVTASTAAGESTSIKKTLTSSRPTLCGLADIGYSVGISDNPGNVDKHLAQYPHLPFVSVESRRFPSGMHINESLRKGADQYEGITQNKKHYNKNNNNNNSLAEDAKEKKKIKHQSSPAPLPEYGNPQNAQIFVGCTERGTLFFLKNLMAILRAKVAIVLLEGTGDEHRSSIPRGKQKVVDLLSRREFAVSIEEAAADSRSQMLNLSRL